MEIDMSKLVAYGRKTIPRMIYFAVDKYGPCFGPNPRQESILDVVRGSVQEMLGIERIQGTMVNLAMMFDEDTNNGERFHRHLPNAKTYVKIFVSNMRRQFPYIVVDYRMETLKAIVVHKRTRNSSLRDGYFLYINGNILRAMEIAPQEEYARYMFTLKLLTLCEIAGRMVVSDLGRSGCSTPHTISPPVPAEARGLAVGNSSRMIEFHLFGGTIELGDDGSQRDIQARIPYLMSSNFYLRRIEKSEISDIASGTISHFPIMTDHTCTPITLPEFRRAGHYLSGIYDSRPFYIVGSFT